MRAGRDADVRHWIFSHIILWNDENRNYCNKIKRNISITSSMKHVGFYEHFKGICKRSKY